MNYLGTSFIVALSITSLSASCCGSGILHWQTVEFERATEHAGKMIAKRHGWRRRNTYATAAQVTDVGCQAVIGVLQQIFNNDDTKDIADSMNQVDRIAGAIRRKLDRSRVQRQKKLEKSNAKSTEHLRAVQTMLKRIRQAYDNNVLTHAVLQDNAPDPRWSQAYKHVQGAVIDRMVAAIRTAPHTSQPVDNVNDACSDGARSNHTLASHHEEQPPIAHAGPPVEEPAADVVAHAVDNAPLVPAEQTWWQKHTPTLKKARNYALGITGAALLLDLTIRKKKSLLYKAGKSVGKAGKKVWAWLTGKTDANEQIGQVTPEEAAALAQQLLAEGGHESVPIEQGHE